MLILRKKGSPKKKGGKMNAKWITICSITGVLVLVGFFVAGYFGGINADGNDRRNGNHDGTSIGIVDDLRDEQSGAVGIVDRIEEVAGETADALNELRAITGRQYSILEAARARAQLLEDYYRRTGGILGNNDSGNQGE